MAAPRASGRLGFTEILHEKVGLNPMFMDDYSEADEDPVSPTSSPRRSALTTRSRRARFALDGLDEDAVMTLQPQKGAHPDPTCPPDLSLMCLQSK